MVESTKEAVDKIDPEKIESMDVVKYGKSEKGLVKIKLKSDSLKSIQGQVLRTVDQMPEFPGGNVALLKYLANNIKYPGETKEKNIQGRLISRIHCGY